MRKNVWILPIIVVTAFLTPGCSKEDDNTATAPELLSAHDWTINTLSIPSVSDPLTDSSVLTACDSLSTMIFYPDYRFNFKDTVNSACSQSRFHFQEGTWTYDLNTDSLYLFGTERNQVWKLLEINDSLLKASFQDSISPAVINKTQITLKRK